MAVESTLLSEFSILIAGGACRKAVFRQDLGKSDIDVFFKQEWEMKEASKYLNSLGCHVKVHPNCHGVKVYEKNSPVGTSEGLYLQLIHKETYPTMEELLSNFDFTVCQFGYAKGKFYYTSEAYEHEQHKVLAANPFAKRKPNLTRFVKYAGMGYTPSVELFDQMFLQDRESITLRSEEISEYGFLYGTV